MDKQSRKDIAAQYKTRTMTGGVYCIRCTETGQVWLHKTTDMQGSKNRHTFSLSTKTCPEPSMLKDWKAYGSEAFKFEVLEELTKKETQTAEEFASDIEVLFEMRQEKQKK